MPVTKQLTLEKEFDMETRKLTIFIERMEEFLGALKYIKTLVRFGVTEPHRHEIEEEISALQYNLARMATEIGSVQYKLYKYGPSSSGSSYRDFDFYYKAFIEENPYVNLTDPKTVEMIHDMTERQKTRFVSYMEYSKNIWQPFCEEIVKDVLKGYSKLLQLLWR